MSKGEDSSVGIGQHIYKIRSDEGASTTFEAGGFLKLPVRILEVSRIGGS